MRETILNQSQLNLIQSKLISRDHKRFFVIARYTGQNIRTICNLKVSDLYNKDGVLMTHIQFSGIRSGVHSFPIFEPFRRELMKYIPENFIHDAWLFPSSQKIGKPITPSNIDKCLKSAVTRAKLEHLNVSIKMIRESFIYELHRTGMSNDHIKDILGVVTIPEIINKLSSESIDYRHALTTIFR